MHEGGAQNGLRWVRPSLGLAVSGPEAVDVRRLLGEVAVTEERCASLDAADKALRLGVSVGCPGCFPQPASEVGGALKGGNHVRCERTHLRIDAAVDLWVRAGVLVEIRNALVAEQVG